MNIWFFIMICRYVESPHMIGEAKGYLASCFSFTHLSYINQEEICSDHHSFIFILNRRNKENNNNNTQPSWNGKKNILHQHLRIHHWSFESDLVVHKMNNEVLRLHKSGKDLSSVCCWWCWLSVVSLGHFSPWTRSDHHRHHRQPTTAISPWNNRRVSHTHHINLLTHDDFQIHLVSKDPTGTRDTNGWSRWYSGIGTEATSSSIIVASEFASAPPLKSTNHFTS